MADRSNTIAGRNFNAVVKDDRYVLADGATVMPGMLLEVTGRTANGDAMTVQPHSTAGGPVSRVVVAACRGHPPNGDQTRTLRKDQPYDEAGEMVEAIAFRPGDSSDNLLLATGEDVSPGDDLVSDGAGGFQAALGDGTQDAGIVVSADEALNNTSGEQARIGGTF